VPRTAVRLFLLCPGLPIDKPDRHVLGSHGFAVATGGAGRDRTGDLLNANQALSQLSYSPFFKGPGSGKRFVPNPDPSEINRGQLDAETRGPAPGRFGKIVAPQVEIPERARPVS
jgi:hypothetical protein